jgi:hypothetical protein
VARHVTVTGTRSITAQTEAQLPGLFEGYLRPFAAPDATFFIGGAVGIDTSALDWLAERSRVALTVVVPCTVAEQPVAAGEAIRRWQRRGRLTEIVELSADTLSTSAYHARNRWMVDRSSFVIGFPHGPDSMSGTWYTVNYAAEQGKPRLVVPI